MAFDVQTAVVVALLLSSGIALGVLVSRWRSRQDVAVLERQITVHMELSGRQHQAFLDAVREQDGRRDLREVYDDLARWAHVLERTVEEVWSACQTADEQLRKRALVTVEDWVWGGGQVPAEHVAASLCWSGDVHRRVREFRATSFDFMFAARTVLKHDQRVGLDSKPRDTSAREPYLATLAALDEVRACARVELGVS
ncbi:hypothetical protein GCM10022247_39730 [Allokutzneria multivorans]|uniref:Secreted protein n=1 Tax=Allokutzneria multivorans TaxID=1142134 RepID=A0ABP7SLG7_9PSEU